MEPLGWSPDGSAVAVIVHDPAEAVGIQPSDWDLVEITPAPLAARYVATIRSALAAMWTPGDYSWVGGRLIAAQRGRQATITRKAPSEIGWTTTPPLNLSTPRECH